MKLVSIIVPIYDNNLFISCYNNLINQTYKNIEIIFVSNSVNDIVKDKRVLFINVDSNNLSELRKYGLKESHGEYICFIDANDIIDKQFIYKLVKSIEDNNSNISIDRSKIYCRNIYFKLRRKPKLIDLNMKHEYLSTLPYRLDGKLFKRKLLDLDKLSDEDVYFLYTKCRYVSCVNYPGYYLSRNNKAFIIYEFDKMLDTFDSLRKIYNKYEKYNKLEDYFYEIEMLFIKNISFIICNIMDNVSDKIYRYKFISVILDYLEYFFPDWDKNPYYIRGYKLGELFDKYYIRKAYNEIYNIKRKKLYISLDEVYSKYKKIRSMYDKIDK